MLTQPPIVVAPRRPRSITVASALLLAGAGCNIVIVLLSFTATSAVAERLTVLDALPDDAAAAHGVLVIWRIAAIVSVVVLAALGLAVRRPGRSIWAAAIATAILGLAGICVSGLFTVAMGSDSLTSNYPMTGHADGDVFAAAIPPPYPIVFALVQLATFVLVLAALVLLSLRRSGQFYRSGFLAGGYPATPPYRGEHS